MTDDLRDKAEKLRHEIVVSPASCLDLIETALRDVRDEALEEAAKQARIRLCNANCSEIISHAIRALKEAKP